jgi:hypothetical protein
VVIGFAKLNLSLTHEAMADEGIATTADEGIATTADEGIATTARSENGIAVTRLGLDHQVVQLAQKIFDQAFSHTPHQEIESCDLTKDERTVFNEYMVSCLPSETLLAVPDPQSGQDYLAECHCITVNGEREHPYGPHIDNDGGLPIEVNTGVVTCLVYLKNNVEQSNLLIWDAEPAFDTLATPADRTIDTHPTEDGFRVVVMRGDVWHAPEPLKGHGKRCAFVYQAGCANS